MELLGCAHRTIFVYGCAIVFHEDTAQLLSSRCGAVERWWSAEDQLVVVFASMDSMHTATALNGITMGGPEGKLRIIKASERSAPNTTTAMIAGRADQSSSSCNEKETVSQRRRELITMMSRGVKEASQHTSTLLSGSLSQEDRDALLRATAERQCRALIVLCRQWSNMLQKELEPMRLDALITSNIVEQSRHVDIAKRKRKKRSRSSSRAKK